MTIPLYPLLASRKRSRSLDEAQASKKKQYSAKRKAEAEPDTDHEQPQRNIGAPESSKRLKIDRDQGIHHISCLADLLRAISCSFSQEGRTGGYPQKVGGCGGDMDTSTHIGNSS